MINRYVGTVNPVQNAVMLCYKIASKPDLRRVAEYFRIPIGNNVPEVLHFMPSHLRAALSMETSMMTAWYFSFGCLCLVNFEVTDAYRFVNLIESTGEPVDYRRFFAHVEREELRLEANLPEEAAFREIWLHAAALAKSVELKHLEDSVNKVFDQTERFFTDLQRGFSNPSSRWLTHLTTQVVKLQLDVVKSLRILDRPNDIIDTMKAREIYDNASEAHELNKRFSTIQLKIDDVMEFISPYRKIGFSQKEHRLLVLELILLALFPLSYLIRNILGL